MANVKEFLLGIDGKASVEYDDGSVDTIDLALGGVKWISESSVVVAIEGPDSKQYAVFERQLDGSVQMQIVPRTGTLASLVSLAGSDGEISSATDFPAIFKFTGTEGTGHTFWPNGVKVITDNASSNASKAPNCNIIWCTGTGLPTLLSGYKPGQEIRIVNKTAASRFCPHAEGTSLDGTNLAIGEYIDLRWDGTIWTIFSKGTYNKGFLSIALGSGAKAPGNEAVALGAGSEAKSDYSTSLGGGIVESTALGGLALNYGGLVTAENGVAIRGESAGYNSITLNGPTTIWNSELGLIRAWGGSGYKCDTSDIALTRATSSTSEAQLTVDGASPSASNTLGGTWTGVRAFEIEVVGHLIGSAGAVAMKRRGLIYKNGTTAQILGSVQTIGTDIIAGSVGSPTLSITAGSTYNDLSVSVTPGVSGSMIWGARIHLTSLVV